MGDIISVCEVRGEEDMIDEVKLWGSELMELME